MPIINTMNMRHVHSMATESEDGFISAEDKKKLNGIAANANNYVHPTTAGNKHIPTGGSSGQILKYSASGTAQWSANDADTVDGKHAADLQNYNNLTNKPIILKNLQDVSGYTGSLRMIGNNSVTGNYSVAEGQNNQALGTNCHVGGQNSVAKGNSAIAYGLGCYANSSWSALAMGAISAASVNDDIFIIKSSDATSKKFVLDESLMDTDTKTTFTSIVTNKKILVLDQNMFNYTTRTFTVASINTTEYSITIKENFPSVFQPHYIVYIDAEQKGNSYYTPIAIGRASVATGFDSVAIGFGCRALASQAFAFGTSSIAKDTNSFAVGSRCKALGSSSIALGSGAEATNGVAIGAYVLAQGNYGTAFGYKTIANEHQLAIGRYNKGTDAGGSSFNTTGSAFIIGNGTFVTSATTSNCFRVQYDGKVYSKGAYNTSGADYAELFEWKDGNSGNEDRRGLFVKLQGNKVSIANSPNDNIWGIISSNPSTLGNNHSETWNGMYLTNVWGDILTERKIIPPEYREEMYIATEIDENGNNIDVEKTRQVLEKEAYEADVPILNPAFDPEQPYIPREERPEWAKVGMFGQIVTIDDGTCEVGGLCNCSKGGIATKSEEGYYVMERLDESHILVFYGKYKKNYDLQ